MSSPPLLPLRDQLALDRTSLANQRTWLASARTALALFVSGVGFIEIFQSPWVVRVGWGMIWAALPVVGIGWLHFRREQRQLQALEEQALGPGEVSTPS